MALSNDSARRRIARPARPLTLRNSVALAAVAALAVWPQTALALTGALDTSFDGDGKVLADFAKGADDAHAVAIQPDGAIVAAGAASSRATGSDFAVARFQGDGSLDPTFDGDGRATVDFTGGDDAALGAAVQADGKIVAVGQAYGGKTSKNDVGLARFNANGSLDATFGAGGKVRTAFNPTGDEQANAVALQPDGKIVVAGALNGDFLVARYNGDGTLDASFGTGGRVTIAFTPAGVDVAMAVAVQPDGKIVATGYASGGTTGWDFALARCDASGALDASGFGAGGVVRTAVSSAADVVRGIALQADGSIVAAGYASNAGTGKDDFALARYTASGVLDPIFGGGGPDGDGLVTTNFGGAGAAVTSDAYAVTLVPRTPAVGDPDQDTFKIVAGGQVQVDRSDWAFALARYRPSGDLDAGTALVTTQFSSGSDTCWALAVDPAGRIVAAGRGAGASGTDFALARYN
jgi:uncharacterized delta-60 repeat protein